MSNLGEGSDPDELVRDLLGVGRNDLLLFTDETGESTLLVDLSNKQQANMAIHIYTSPFVQLIFYAIFLFIINLLVFCLKDCRTLTIKYNLTYQGFFWCI